MVDEVRDMLSKLQSVKSNISFQPENKSLRSLKCLKQKKLSNLGLFQGKKNPSKTAREFSVKPYLSTKFLYTMYTYIVKGLDKTYLRLYKNVNVPNVFHEEHYLYDSCLCKAYVECCLKRLLPVQTVNLKHFTWFWNRSFMYIEEYI